jgi:hypothetical protein
MAFRYSEHHEALVVEALALFHARQSDLSFIGASEMRSLEPHHYRRIPRLRDDVRDLLDAEISAAITAGGLAVNYRRDAGKAIATMCMALVQWFQPGGRTTPGRIAKEYAQFALRLGRGTGTRTRRGQRSVTVLGWLPLVRPSSRTRLAPPAEMGAVQHGRTATHTDRGGRVGTQEDGDLRGWTRVDVLPTDGAGSRRRCSAALDIVRDRTSRRTPRRPVS